MPNDTPRITILGAGPAGIACAYALTKDGRADVSVIERAPVAGGNAASFQAEGIWCDFGSHRFHPASDPDVLADVKDLLGKDLLLQPRHGRIRLGGKWIHFPLKPLDALLHLPKKFGFSLVFDSLAKPFRRSSGERTFSSVLYDGLGPTISESFYFPYVRKLWGLEPDKLAVTLAERRISSGSVGKILKKMLRTLPGFGDETAGRFFYPRKGFGQISGTMQQRASEAGADFRLSQEITRIERDNDRVVAVHIKEGERDVRHTTDQVLSTIPLTPLVRLIDPPPPPEVLAAADSIRFRGMILVYLVLETRQFTEYDAHYFPETSIPISRMSEPKNYSSAVEPSDVTILCAELPCDPGEKWWDMTDDELGEAFCSWLEGVGLPVTVPIRRTFTRRLSHAYPVYDLGYQEHFEKIDNWLLGLKGLLVFGRQGLFAHDNTHHAFAMAYAAAECLDDEGRLDADRWANFREEFKHHTVED
ncbi:MAG: FAD-dependent oxidoreductase [Silicimonas sp.]|nr:FAD-dependent oxidoreductase [Silicimonas sp.]